jgi:hypothetical protein
MSEFKINLKPKIKERDYDVDYVKNSRKEKKCCVCNKKIYRGESATTFAKRVSKGFKTEYLTFYTCGLKNSPCTIKKAEELKISLP